MKPVDQQLADLAARIANLEQAPVRIGHNLRDHTDVDLQGAAAGTGVAYGSDGFWRPGAAGATLPTLFLHSTTTSVATGTGTDLQWDEPDGTTTVNLGGAFTFDSGTPTDIEVVSACIIDIDVYLLFAPDDGTKRRLELVGADWGPVEFWMPTIAADGIATSVVISAKVPCVDNDTISISASHDASSAVSVSQGFIGITRVALL